MVRRLLTIAAAMLSSALATEVAATDTSSYAWSVTGGIEYFRWQELDQSGSQLVKETGPRAVLNVAYSNLARRSAGWLLGARAGVYGGEVNYNGETVETGQAVDSDTRYLGGRAEGLFGSRLSAILGEGIDLDLIATLGGEWWLRSIRDSKLSNGTRVSGYDEYYTVVYAKLGLGPVWQLEGRQIRLQGGIKYPFYTHEVVDTSSLGFEEDAKLEPQGRISAYASITTELYRRSSGALFLNGYYEGYRFGDSDPDVIRRSNGSLVSVYQPRIRADVFGIEAGWRF